ncbi:hypothetical protein PIB30_092425 [Stylosanthes scabra]|uniref:Uncharacterized protein n=1 Tax=Stylosanthes scabra TaxID=79078 RepID=A0ABU6TUE3_9FABA|nr:hypothetical protein [Stylosanthes scabra]
MTDPCFHPSALPCCEFARRHVRGSVVCSVEKCLPHVVAAEELIRLHNQLQLLLAAVVVMNHQPRHVSRLHGIPISYSSGKEKTGFENKRRLEGLNSDITRQNTSTNIIYVSKRWVNDCFLG